MKERMVRIGNVPSKTALLLCSGASGDSITKDRILENITMKQLPILSINKQEYSISYDHYKMMLIIMLGSPNHFIRIRCDEPFMKPLEFVVSETGKNLQFRMFSDDDIRNDDVDEMRWGWWYDDFKNKANQK